MVTFKKYLSLNEVATPAPRGGSSYGGGKITERHNGTRNMPLSPGLKSAISTALAGSGLDWVSHSGGQPSSGPNRVGSHRHDNGNGSDGEFVESGSGRVLSGDNPQDRQKIAAVLPKLKSAGVQGFGWDSSTTGSGNYMGPTRFHLDIAGPAGVWGSSKSSNTAARWVVSALGGVNQGNVQGDTGDGSNLPPGTSQGQGSAGAPADYDSPMAAAKGMAQGVDLAFGKGMFQ